MESEDPQRFRLGADIHVEPSRCRLIRDGEPVHLEPRVMALLVHLSQSAGRIVSKTELMQEIWRANVVDEAVHRAVSLLRTALGDRADQPRLIETVPRQGYRLMIAPTRPRKLELGRAAGWALLGAVAVVMAVALTGRSPEATRSNAPAQSRAPLQMPGGQPHSDRADRIASSPRQIPAGRLPATSRPTPRAVTATAPTAPGPLTDGGDPLAVQPTPLATPAPEAPKAPE